MTRLRARLVLAVLCAAQFLVVLDITVVNVALPAIREDLAIAPERLHWAISAYAVAFGGLLLVAGRLADLLGRRRVFLAGIALFGAFSLVCGLAPSGDVLVASRALQGVGAALISPAALAILAQASGEGRPRARALAVWGTVGALAAASGVVLGGILVELLSWRWIFLVNVPVAAAALMIGFAVLPPHRARAGRRIDLTGGLLVTAVPALAVAGLSQAAIADWSDPAVLGPLAGAAGVGVLAWARDRTAADPLLPARVLRSPAAGAANVAGFLHGAVMLGSFLLLTLHMQEALGMSPIEAGVGLLAVRATSAVWAPLGARLVAAVGGRALLAAAMAAMTAALAALARAPADGGYAADLLPGLLVLGLAIPLAFLTVNLIALEGVPAADAGLASGLLNTSQWVGGAVGVAAVSAVGAGAGMWVCVALGLAGTAVALALVRAPRRAPAAAPAGA
jgi:EmrB/QacA subfamily drug resistance transporter